MFEQPAVQRFIALAQKQIYRHRQLIMRGGETPQILLVLQGSARLVFEHETQEQAVLGHLHPGDFFGERSLCGPARENNVVVRARGDTIVAVMDTEAFKRMAQQDASIALHLLGQLALRLDHSRRQIADHFFLDVTERLRRKLISLSEAPDAQRNGPDRTIRINRQELAAMIGCSREMIARGLKIIEGEGMIRIDGHNVELCATPASAIRR